MIDYFDLGSSGPGGQQVYQTPVVDSNDYFVWQKPRNCKFVHFFAIAAGSGGGGGCGGAAGSTRGGGGGGGAGSGITAFIPAIILPQFLYVAPGLGGVGGPGGSSGNGTNGGLGGGTFISCPFAPAYNTSPAVIIIQCNTTATVGSAGTSSGGGAGAGSNGVPVTNPTGILGRVCLWQSFLSGSNGAAGGTNAGGGAIQMGEGLIQAGSGGGGVNTSDVAGAGGGLTGASISLTTYMPVIPGATGDGFAGLGRVDGSQLAMEQLGTGRGFNPWVLTGGGGGGGNAAGAGGEGGNGSYGCGGGGGGGGLTTGGRGGRGGNGLAIITWW